jgi:hypothetical protein
MAEIVLDKRLKARHGGLCQEHVGDLADAYKRGDPIEAPVVWRIKGLSFFYLTRGWHRHAALKKIERKEVECVLKDGSFEDALLDAVGDNQAHGLRRTNKDKRQCVRVLLDRCPDWSERKIAEAAGVHHDLVGEVKKGVADSATDPNKPLKKPLSPAAREAYRPLLDLVKNPPADPRHFPAWVAKIADLASAFSLVRQEEGE